MMLMEDFKKDTSKHVEALKEETNKSLKELQENKTKQVKELNKTIQDLKMEVEAIQKTPRVTTLKQTNKNKQTKQQQNSRK